jgi:sarcosine oxidase
MDHTCDVIVLGLGAMGSAAASQLAEAGLRVVAFDAFTPPHLHGSSHGRSRIFRQAYFEDPGSVHLLVRARELWQKLEHDCGLQLFHPTGALMIGPRDGKLVAGSAESARLFHLPHEILSASDLRGRWPMFRVPDDAVALLEPNAGYLNPELCIEQQLALAARHGAHLHYNEPVTEWKADAGTVTVTTARRTCTAGRLVITAGPWAPQLLAGLPLSLRVTRQVIYWFEPRLENYTSIDSFREDRFPIYMIETSPAEPMLYGFPLTGPASEGLKVAVHGSAETCTPETACRDIRPADEQYIRRRLAATLPTLAGRLLHAETCLYTMTPDENFILGPHPHYPNIVLASGFSGHGFKFAPVIGELIAGLVTTGDATRIPAMFSPTRNSLTANPEELRAKS